MGSKDCYFFAENQRFCRRDGQKHRLTPQDAPRSFPRAFLTVFCFSRVLVRFLAQTIRCLWRVKNMIVRTGARNHGYSLIFWQKSECPQNWQHGQTVKRLWRNGKLLQKALGKLRGASWRVYGCFWPSRRVKRVFSAKKKQFQEPKNIVPQYMA